MDVVLVDWTMPEMNGLAFLCGGSGLIPGWRKRRSFW
jgi:hypothetical protein